jgi:hypothetical protein
MQCSFNIMWILVKTTGVPKTKAHITLDAKGVSEL